MGPHKIIQLHYRQWATISENKCSTVLCFLDRKKILIKNDLGILYIMMSEFYRSHTELPKKSTILSSMGKNCWTSVELNFIILSGVSIVKVNLYTRRYKRIWIGYFLCTVTCEKAFSVDLCIFLLNKNLICCEIFSNIYK